MPPSRLLPFLHLVTTRGPLAHRPLHNAPAGGKGNPNPTGPAKGGDGDGDGDDEDLDARITRLLDQKLNPAITTHLKRFGEKIEKTLGEQIAKLAPPKPEDKPEDKPAPGGAPPKADPELLKLREGYEKLQKQFAEESTARKAAEQKAARDATHADLRTHLDALGVKGARARAVIADLEQSGALKLNESGQYELTVKRARMKGAKPEALTFDDLAAGLKDWAATEDAKEFLPPPANLNPGKRPGLPASAPRAPTNPNAPPRELSDQERAERATETLTKQGIDLTSLLD